jgi:hypothetical protein
MGFFIVELLDFGSKKFAYAASKQGKMGDARESGDDS